MFLTSEKSEENQEEKMASGASFKKFLFRLKHKSKFCNSNETSLHKSLI